MTWRACFPVVNGFAFACYIVLYCYTVTVFNYYSKVAQDWILYRSVIKFILKRKGTAPAAKKDKLQNKLRQ